MERERSRGLLVAIAAMLAALLVLGTILLVVVLTRTSDTPPAVVESGAPTTGSSAVTTTTAENTSATRRPRLTTTSAAPTTVPPTTPITPPTTVATTSPTTVAPTAPPTLPPSAGPSWFHTPTGNITCMMAGDMARCDIIARNWSSPPTPTTCPLDYGDALEVSSAGADFLCHGDTVNGAPDVLPYGVASRFGAYECDSATAGVTCRNIATGHGFFIARERYELF